MERKERMERYAHLTGQTSWEVSSYKGKEHTIVLNDGPSGVRKPEEGDTGTLVAVCIPTPAALAASFDPEVCHAAGELLAADCKSKGTHILLAPGVNIKRSALCGRNFEYFSEDPYLAGRLAACYINGLEESGVGSCIKHYVANNREFARTINSSEMSLRALNEIYLRVFSYALENSRPTALMTSYNRVNGEYVGESEYLLKQKLRGEMGFGGLVMSDWCAVNDKARSIHAGLDLEMPPSKRSDETLDRAFGTVFTEEDLLCRDEEFYQATKRFFGREKTPFDMEEGHKKAVYLAERTQVLLKNGGVLPLRRGKKLLVLGRLAEENYFVGGGSGWVNAYKKPSLLDVLKAAGEDVVYLPCYDKENLLVTEEALRKAAEECDGAILLVGQTEGDESEGFDRVSISLAAPQEQTLRLAAKCLPSFATVVVAGSVVALGEVLSLSSAVLLSYLAGEGQSEALFRNLYGEHNPAGRLPETWIKSLEANPLYRDFEPEHRDVFHTYYREDIFVGYRYYDRHPAGVLLPFGAGMSYTTFAYTDFAVVEEEDCFRVEADLTNTGARDGEDVLLVFAAKKNSDVYRPEKELKGFGKFAVRAGETKRVCVTVKKRDLAAYCVETDRLEVEGGEYDLLACANCEKIYFRETVNVPGRKFLQGRTVPALKERAESGITVNSPIGLILESDDLDAFVKERGIDMDAEAFRKTHAWMRNATLRELMYNCELTFDQIVDFAAYLDRKRR